MTETQLQQAVLDLAALLGVLAYHTHDSRRSQPGFPDLVLAGRKRTIFRELKSATGRLSPAQQEWGTRLSESRQDWAVWRPADLQSLRILRELQAIR